MVHAYAETQPDDAMGNLGDMFEYAVKDCGQDADGSSLILSYPAQLKHFASSLRLFPKDKRDAEKIRHPVLRCRSKATIYLLLFFFWKLTGFHRCRTGTAAPPRTATPGNCRRSAACRTGCLDCQSAVSRSFSISRSV